MLLSIPPALPSPGISASPHKFQVGQSNHYRDQLFEGKGADPNLTWHGVASVKTYWLTNSQSREEGGD